MKVLALASYPREAAATRYRLEQFVGPLAERGITLTIRPFLDSRRFEQLYRRGALPRTIFGLITSALLRFKDVAAATKADVILIQREAMIFGPPVIEWLMTRVLKRPVVLDLDDATYVSYTSPTYGGIGSTLEWFSKTDDLLRWAKLVICGNRSIAEYVSSKGSRACVIPTVVDTEVFRPAGSNEEPGGIGSASWSNSGGPVLGWIGTHSTFPYLESIFPVLTKLAKDHHFRLKIVGAGKAEITVPGVEVENLPWSLEREVRDFQSIDIGLYPIDASLYSNKWAAGKSGFKAIQYMAVGVPYVATPVGASKDFGEADVTHFFASNPEEWQKALAELIVDAEKREKMGTAGRGYAARNFALPEQADKLAAALREAANIK